MGESALIRQFLFSVLFSSLGVISVVAKKHGACVFDTQMSSFKNLSIR
jgi:hypothetical protein